MQVNDLRYLRHAERGNGVVFLSPTGPVEVTDAVMALARSVVALSQRLEKLEAEKGGQ